jgi:hypothetical protein
VGPFFTDFCIKKSSFFRNFRSDFKTTNGVPAGFKEKVILSKTVKNRFKTHLDFYTTFLHVKKHHKKYTLQLVSLNDPDLPKWTKIGSKNRSKKRHFYTTGVLK